MQIKEGLVKGEEIHHLETWIKKRRLKECRFYLWPL
jgi:hypothetical protein